MIDISRYIDFIVDNKLTQTQFTFLYLVYYQTISPSETLRLVKKYKSRIVKDALITEEQKKDLIDKGFLKLSDNTGNFSSMVLTEKFLEILIDDYTAAEQIFDLYPASLEDRKTGSIFVLKAYDRELFRKKYGRAINYSYQEHLEVVKDVKYAVRYNMIKMKIESFVVSKGWLDIRKERLKFNNRKQNLIKSTDL